MDDAGPWAILLQYYSRVHQCNYLKLNGGRRSLLQWSKRNRQAWHLQGKQKKRLAIKLANSELKLPQQGDLTIRASFSNILWLIFLVNDVLFFKLRSGSLLSKWTFFCKMIHHEKARLWRLRIRWKRVPFVALIRKLAKFYHPCFYFTAHLTPF